MNYESYTNAAKQAFSVFVDNYTALPKTEKEVTKILEKTKTAAEADLALVQELTGISQKCMLGTATQDDALRAQSILTQLATSVQFAFLVAIPGVLFILPTLISTAKKFNINIVPANLAAQF